jgi:hypothetical protein
MKSTAAAKQAAWTVLRSLALAVATFVVVEGVCSVILLIRAFVRAPPGGTAPYLAFDPELGWAPRPNADCPEAGSVGPRVKIDSRGLRNDGELTDAVPPGKVRILCSGDSFTFGMGVDVGSTWCAQLGKLDDRIEPVNLGVIGYGLDQAFLRFRRSAQRLDYDVHVFAFVFDDFVRARSGLSGVYPKPFLRREGGSVEAAPVPEVGSTRLEIARRLRPINTLRLTELLRPARQPWSYGSEAEWMGTMFAMFEQLEAAHARRGKAFMTMYLPEMGEFAGVPMQQAYLASELGRRNIPFVDLTGVFRRMDAEQRARMYIPPSSYAGHHLSVDGNAFVAHQLYELLLAKRILKPR